MSDIADFETTVLPLEDFKKILSAARHGVVDMGTMTVNLPFVGKMSVPHQLSAMGYLEELAKNPEKGSPEWQKALVGAGTGAAASTVGLGVLMAATGPLAPFAAIGLGVAAPLLGKNRVCTLLVANGTEGELVKDGLYIDRGVQTGRPVVEEINEDTGRATATSPDTIPGLEFLEGWPEEDIPDMWLGGLGLYRFEKDLSLVIGWHGTCGAIGFRSSDPNTKNKRFAVSWLVPETGKPAFAVTADLDGKYDSLEDFYDKTAGERKSDNFDIGKHRRKNVAKIRGSMIHREYPSTENDNDLLLTVAITPG
ncbi:MAG: hypothetical protein AAGI92_04285 [Pseudomonadota bacterium]